MAKTKGLARTVVYIGLAAMLLSLGITANQMGTPAPASAAVGTTSLPQWMARWILRNATRSGAVQDLALIGETCPPWAVTTWGLAFCYSSTSPEPARWHAGVVQTGGPVLNARKWSATSADITRTFPNNWKLKVFCQQTGTRVYGQWGWTNVWDYVGTFGGTPWFVSDGFVNTGSNGYVAGSCSSTNWGDNPIN
ncbi:hypothetical protein RCH22_000428 [Cryobacterium psychrotolerans]|nr:hypothetical protein [Cryobacterium psychrotolerans]